MTGTLNFLLAVFIALKLEALKYFLWRVTNFAISARDSISQGYIFAILTGKYEKKALN